MYAFLKGAIDRREPTSDPLHLRMGSRPGLLTSARLDPSQRIEEVRRSPHFAGSGAGSVGLASLHQGHLINLALSVEYCHPHVGAP